MSNNQRVNLAYIKYMYILRGSQVSVNQTITNNQKLTWVTVATIIEE